MNKIRLHYFISPTVASTRPLASSSSTGPVVVRGVSTRLTRPATGYFPSHPYFGSAGSEKAERELYFSSPRLPGGNPRAAGGDAGT